ncbi:MAG: hypothetical protein FWB79_06090 [Treponema sp.]|nr:hypothetical protein [Treponema sp.]
MHVDNPEFSTYGDIGGVKRGRDGAYLFDGAAGSAGISFSFPEGWDGFDRVVFSVRAQNLRPEDGAMALIVKDGYQVWGSTVTKSPYPWIGEGEHTLTYPAAVFASGAVSFQLNETFGHSTNWKISITRIDFQAVDKNFIRVVSPAFSVFGDTENTTPNVDGSYTFAGDAATLIGLEFPQGWNSYESVTIFIGGVENHVPDMTMSLIVKNRYRSWADIDKSYANRYPDIEPGDNVFTYPTLVFNDGMSLQLNQYGHSANWTMHVTQIVFHDGPIGDVIFE